MTSVETPGTVGAPAISVVVPVYDAQEHLAECLEALLAQDEADFEIVAVDDGSRDESPALLERYRQRDARVRVLRQDNRGPSAARNAGLAHARGEFVWFVDADDVVAPGALGVLVGAARADEAQIVAFNAERFDDAKRSAVYAQPKPAGVVTGEAWIRTVIAQREFRHFPWLIFCRRDFLAASAIAFATGILHEDIGWTTECLLHAQRLVYADQVLYRYRRHPASLTGGRDDARLLRRIDSYFSVVEQLRAINARYPMAASTRRCLRAEIVAQGLQVDQLTSRLADPALRARVRERCRSAGFWQMLWGDAVDLRSRRQVLQVMLRERIRLRQRRGSR